MPRAAPEPFVLREALDDLCQRYDRRYIESDPVGIVRRFDDPEDREIVGLIAAGLAYGRVASIRGSLESLLAWIGPRPARFAAGFEPARDAPLIDRFVHRFTRGRDIALLLHLVRQAKERAGSLESFFLEGDPDPGAPTVGPALDAFGSRLFALDARPSRGTASCRIVMARVGSCPPRCRFRLQALVPLPAMDGKAGRRGPTARLGPGSPSRLVLPLDTHLLRVVRALGWTARKSAGWPMALEATARLRTLDPDDPIRFDFALSRLGILGLLDAPGGRLSARRVRRTLMSR
jgi:hypothetical protein